MILYGHSLSDKGKRERNDNVNFIENKYAKGENNSMPVDKQYMVH